MKIPRFGLLTLDDAALQRAAASLAEKARGITPAIIIGIRSGGFTVAEQVAKHFSGAVLLPITRRRAGTEKKQNSSFVKNLLRKLPYVITDRLRIVEHIWLTQRHPPQPREFTPDEGEMAAIASLLRERPGANILIVDDAVDSGATLLAVYETVRGVAGVNAVIRTVAITVTTTAPLIEPDYFLYRYVLCRFPGHSTSKPEAVLIFDLDETILTVNSFPFWVRYMLLGHFACLSVPERIMLSLRAGMLLVRRKLLGQNHYRIKREFQRLWATALAKDPDKIALRELNALLLTTVRPNMAGVLKQVAEGQADAILATAAVAEYAEDLGRRLGFTHIVTTPAHGEQNAIENRSDRKRDTVLAVLSAQGWGERRRIFFTDHEEDLPLIRECAVTLWFGSEEKLAAVKEAAPETALHACRHCLEGEIMKNI